ncbi:MAG: glycosyltransferase family 39 protein [bacterium]|nr:MAG: glycosyltransferase family 39 protein [bacterium]
MKQLLKLLQTNFVLIVICLLFLGTRLFRIDSIPASVYWDEASIGYNAYSILTTGKDEWGEFLPLHFRAFGEFKLPVYIYSVVASQFVFGMNTFALRFPAVIFGLFSIIGLYLLVLQLTKQKSVSLLSFFLFSITPWFFIFSRTGYEAVAGLALFIWATYFLLKSATEKKHLFLSTMLFIGSFYSYNSFRILTPIVLGLGFVYHLYKKQFAVLILSVLVLSASFFPLYKLYKHDSGLSRLQAVGSSTIFTNYLKNFSPTFLFIDGDSNPRSQIPGESQLYYLDAIFLALGVLYILKSKNPKLFIVLGLLLLAPIPASITKENPHALRSILMSPMLSIISALGIYYLSEIFKKQKQIILIAVVVLYTLSFEGYMYKFGTVYNDLSVNVWQYEYKEIFERQKEGCVSDQYAQPYIFALYYNKVDPNYFIDTRELNPVSDWGFSTVKSFGSYTFPKVCGETN